MNAGDVLLTWGTSNDRPVVGDWNGDGITDLGLYRVTTHQWRLDTDGNRIFNANDTFIPNLGTNNDLPVAGNWN
jgi:endoglucanase